MGMINFQTIINLFKSPIQPAPPLNAKKLKRVVLTEPPLSYTEDLELKCAMHNYERFSETIAPSVEDLDSMTAVYYSDESGKMFYEAIIDVACGDKYYRLMMTIRRYRPYELSVEEITKRNFNAIKTTVFGKDLIKENLN